MRFHQAAGCFAAFVFAALVAAVLAVIPYSLNASLNQFVSLLLLAFGVSVGLVIVLGVPLFLILRESGEDNVFSSIGGGFVIAAITGFFLGQFVGLAFFGLLGALAGFVFWCILEWSGGAMRTAGTSQVLGSGRKAIGPGFAIVAVLAAGAVLALPTATEDRTCHNKFRDKRSIRPALAHIDLSITTEDWPRLVHLFREFAGDELSFLNSGRDEFGERRLLALSLCKELGANIEAREERWAAGIGISIYQLRDGADAAKFVSELAAKLELLWPGSVRFRDARGQIVSMPL